MYWLLVYVFKRYSAFRIRVHLRLGLDAVVAAAISGVVAFMAIALMVSWLRRAGFLPFVIYRLILGTALLIWIA